MARTRVRQRAMIADSTKWGYWMDGVCDLTGTIFFMIAVIMICQRSLHLRRTVTFQILPIFYYILAPFKRKISKISLPSDSDLDTEAFLSTVGTFLIRFWKISWVFFRKLYYRVKQIRIFKYLKQKSNNYFYWFTLKHSSMSKGLYFDLNAWPTIPILNGIYYVFTMN